jgi:hypothetical protein
MQDEDEENDAENYAGEADDYGYEDEEDEGRFFGGGLTEEQRKMLALVDEIDQDEVKNCRRELVYVYRYILLTHMCRQRPLTQLQLDDPFFDSKRLSTKTKRCALNSLTTQKSLWNQKQI